MTGSVMHERGQCHSGCCWQHSDSRRRSEAKKKHSARSTRASSGHEAWRRAWCAVRACLASIQHGVSVQLQLESLVLARARSQCWRRCATYLLLLSRLRGAAHVGCVCVRVYVIERGCAGYGSIEPRVGRCCWSRGCRVGAGRSSLLVSELHARRSAQRGASR